jgi:small subunit ribosomal protein S17
VTRTKKYYAHDPEGQCSLGDIVRIEESKPLSKLKRWRVVTIEQKSVEI